MSDSGDKVLLRYECGGKYLSSNVPVSNPNISQIEIGNALAHRSELLNRATGNPFWMSVVIVETRCFLNSIPKTE